MPCARNAKPKTVPMSIAKHRHQVFPPGVATKYCYRALLTRIVTKLNQNQDAPSTASAEVTCIPPNAQLRVNVMPPVYKVYELVSVPPSIAKHYQA